MRIRSLTTKLTLAFVLTSVASLVLASILIRQFVNREFDDYVVGSQRKEFVANVGAYYETNGSLIGLDHWLRRRDASQAGDPQQGPPSTIPVRFGVVDAGGKVVVPFNNYPPGSMVSPADIAGGMPIVSAKHTVGTV